MTWRDAYDADDERLFVELAGFMFICRSVVESWTTDRISREVGGGLGGSFAAALGDRVRARVTISPDASMGHWVGAPQSDRRGAMDALFKLVAANAALDGATATIWPVARSVVSAQDTAAAALAPQPQTPWARILRIEAGPHAGSQRVSARSAGLAQVAGFELTLAPAPAYSARRLMAVASEFLGHIAGSAPAMPDGPYALPSGRVCRLSRSFDRTSNAVEVRVEI